VWFSHLLLTLTLLLVTHDAGYSNLIMVEELKKLYKIKLYIDDITSSFKVETDSKYEVERRRKK
jgi:hypothetical protein